jgi:3-oxoacyl-[acyl-carrier protein] reductase
VIFLKKALITGASGGIGFATALKMYKEGYFIIAQYNKNQKGIDELYRQVDGNLLAVQADLSQGSGAKTLIETVKKSFKQVDVLVNNAGAGLYKLITQTTEDEWDKLFALNMKSAYVITNAFLPEMIANRKGKIVNVSSIWGQVGASMEVCYSASKSALIGYTKALAKELAPSNINVNCVCPGVIDTPINARFSATEMQDLADETPLGRIGKAEEVAELIAFLASEKSDFITGQVITCDGGFTL